MHVRRSNQLATHSDEPGLLMQASSHGQVGKKCRLPFGKIKLEKHADLLPFDWNSPVPAFLDLATDNAP